MEVENDFNFCHFRPNPAVIHSARQAGSQPGRQAAVQCWLNSSVGDNPVDDASAKRCVVAKVRSAYRGNLRRFRGMFFAPDRLSLASTPPLVPWTPSPFPRISPQGKLFFGSRAQARGRGEASRSKADASFIRFRRQPPRRPRPLEQSFRH